MGWILIKKINVARIFSNLCYIYNWLIIVHIFLFNKHISKENAKNRAQNVNPHHCGSRTYERWSARGARLEPQTDPLVYSIRHGYPDNPEYVERLAESIPKVRAKVARELHPRCTEEEVTQYASQVDHMDNLIATRCVADALPVGKNKFWAKGRGYKGNGVLKMTPEFSSGSSSSRTSGLQEQIRRQQEELAEMRRAREVEEQERAREREEHAQMWAFFQSQQPQGQSQPHPQTQPSLFTPTPQPQFFGGQQQPAYFGGNQQPQQHQFFGGAEQQPQPQPQHHQFFGGDEQQHQENPQDIPDFFRDVVYDQ